MRIGRIALLVVGVLIALAGFGLVSAGGGLLWAYMTQRDAQGFVMSPTWHVTSDGYVVTAEGIDLIARPGDWAWWGDGIEVQVVVTSETPVFVGIAGQADLDAYLAGVSHHRITSLESGGDVGYFDGRTITEDGVAELGAPLPPAAVGIWEVSSTGMGTQSLVWSPEPRAWSAAVMNADGTMEVAASVAAGARSDVTLPTGLGLVGIGLLMLVMATVMIVGGAAASADRSLARA